MSITGIRRSLTDIAGEKYISAVCGASAALGLGSFEELKKIACEKVDFYPEEFAARAEELALRSSEKICEGLSEFGTVQMNPVLLAVLQIFSGAEDRICQDSGRVMSISFAVGFY